MVREEMVHAFSGYVPRPRLAKRLGAAQRLFIVAPAGYGKTALLREHLVGVQNYVYARATSLSRAALWFSLVSEANRLGLVTEPSSGKDAEEWLCQLIGITKPTTIVIDGVMPTIDITEDLRRLFSAPALTVIVTSRQPGHFDVVAIEQQADLIGSAEMLLNAAEVHAGLTAEGLSGRMQAEGGMLPAQYRVAVMMLKRGVPLRGPSDPVITNALLDHLVPEAAHIPLSTFAKLSLPDELNHELVALLTEQGDVATIFEFAEQTGLGQRHADSRGTAFAFDESFRSVLRLRFNASPRQERETAWRAVARWSLENGRPMEALRGASAASDYYLVSRILRDHFETLARLHSEEAAEVLSGIDAVTRMKFPVIAMASALSLYSQGHHARAAIQLLTVASTIRRQSHADDVSEQLWVLGMQAAAFRLGGRHKAAANAAQRAHELMKSLAPLTADASDGFTRVFPHFAISLLYDGEVSTALESLTRSSELLPPQSASAYHVRSLLAGVHALTGNLPEASRNLELLERMSVADEQHGAYIDYGARLASARLAVENGQLDQARQHLDAVGHHFSTIEHWPYMVMAWGTLHLLGNNPHLALAELAAAQTSGAHPKTSKVTQKELERMRLRLLLATGDWVRIAPLLRAAGRTAADDALRALAFLMSRRYEDALVVLGPHRAASGLIPETAAHILAISAAAAHGAGRTAAAEAIAEEAAAVMRAYGLTSPLVCLPATSRAWLERQTGLAPRLYHDGLFPERHRRAVSLSRREKLVVTAMSEGLTRDEIAERLHVSTNTIKSQMRSVYRKLEVSSREEAVLIASELGLLSDPRE